MMIFIEKISSTIAILHLIDIFTKKEIPRVKKLVIGDSNLQAQIVRYPIRNSE